MDVNVTVWGMENGEITELKLDDRFFVIKPNDNLSKKIELDGDIEISPKKKYPHGVKISYLDKWIQQNNFDTFTLEQFYSVYPKQKYNKNLGSNINNLVDKKMITPFNDITNSCLLPLSGKKRFKVNR